MNKRFKELAKQAGLKQTKWADSNTEDEPVRIWQESLNSPGSLTKFAELIVKECADFTDPGMKPFLFKNFGIEE
jgi:hypothetical protein|tara:strand:+ start:1594 stop:1815 length:222 start_codon:yes stop_codon:yes gene_type:complete